MIESKSFPIGGTKIEYLAPYLIWCLSISKKEREINAIKKIQLNFQILISHIFNIHTIYYEKREHSDVGN